MSVSNDSPSRWDTRHPLDEHIAPRLAEGTDSKRYQPMPGDLVEVRSDFLVKHYDAHGVRLGKVDKTAGGDAWWVQLPGYAKTIRFEVGELTLVRRG